MRVPQPTGEPLATHQRFRTSHADEAQQAATRILSAHQLRVPANDRSFDARINAASLGPLTFCFIRYGTDVEVRAAELGDYVALNMPLAGRMRVEHRACDYVADARCAAVFSPEGALRMRWSGELEQLTLRIDAAALTGQLAAMAPNARHRRLRFAPAMDLSGRAAAVAYAIALARDLLEQLPGPDAVPSTLAARAVEMVLTALLLAQPGEHSEELRRAPAPANARTVRRAIEFIEGGPEKIGAIGEIADAVGVSLRTLQAAFRAEVAESPAAYLRRVRLRRAHEALALADPGSGETVTSVALRYGFAHTGRFAAAYRRQYGQAPGTTLRSWQD